MTGVGWAVRDNTVPLEFRIEAVAASEDTRVTDMWPDGRAGVLHATSLVECISAGT
jgi:hypothetical protein